MTGSLVVRGITRRFPGATAPAVDLVDLDVPAGGCVALLGPSGSGKTTVLRMIAGLERLDAGDVLLDGASISACAPERRGMAMVFQRPALLAHLDARDNIAFAGRVRGMSRRAARRLAEDYLALVGLCGLGDRDVRTLSGGQAQRVALARALAREPAVLLLDEPFSALDRPLAAEMHELLLEVRAVLAPTVLLVTHDPVEAARVADTVAVLDQGRVLQHGTPAHVHARPASLVVHRLLGGLTVVDGEVEDGAHASCLGSLALPQEGRTSAGPGQLLLRHEALHVVDPSDPAADVVGQVRERRGAGGRDLLVVACGSQLLHLEVATSEAARTGDVIGIVVPLAARHVVPGGPAGVPNRTAV